MIYSVIMNSASISRLLCMESRKIQFPARSSENIATVAESVSENLSTSTRCRSQELNIPRTTLRRILQKDLAMKPYKVELVQQLKSLDHPSPLQFADWAEDRLTEDGQFYRKIIFSDEAHFHLGG